ncbi:MAG: hypothetical protein E7311_02475 [Clostridiales bacterium]|nr:hypothetical protein [Clostridiales bacterium]
MKKRNIVIGIIVVLIITVIIAIVVYNNTQNNNINNNNETNNIETNNTIQTFDEGNIFLSTVIGNDENKIIIVPNEDELIYKSFKVINVLIDNNTVISKKDGTTITVADIQEKQSAKIEFDGKILSTNPTNIVAKSIEIQ